jgi:hypothetical protein
MPPEPSAAGTLSLDDPRLVPMITAHHLLSERLSGHRLDTRATAVLMQELKSGKRPCMRRNDKTGECEWVSRTFWNDHEIDVRLGFVQIYRGSRGPHGVYDPHSCVEGWLYYVLEPRAERLSLKHQMILAIVERENPDGWEGVSTADIVRQVENGWRAECERRGLAAKKYINSPPKRHAVELALGRRSASVALRVFAPRINAN